MTIKKIISETRVPVKIWTEDVEDQALGQLRNTASLPFVFKHVAAMPDVHFGMGATIGSVVATRGAVIPAAVGVDIGCGMSAVKLPFHIECLGGDEKLRKLRHSIERSIPVGKNGNSEVSDRAAQAFSNLGSNTIMDSSHRIMKNAALQLGSLGGGNHFIEVCTAKNGQAWLMLHSGSRNIGKCLAEIHIEKAKGIMKKYFVDLPDPNLAYLVHGTQEFNDYIHDLNWAQEFATQNRNEMMLRVLKDVSFHIYGDGTTLLEAESLLKVDCHHNYAKMENHFGSNVLVTRKGAVSAREGEFGIIPGSMGTRSYIVKGKGNAESFHSCAHGAGRRMSRTKARQSFTVADLEAQTSGVECRKDKGVLDEIPGAYKNVDEVMNDQSDLVEIVYELKQLICVKG